MSQFDIRKWKSSLNESQQSENKRMTEEEKAQTLEAVSRFNELGKNVYKTQEISELVENIKKLAENASRMAIEETADWFDAVSVKRDTKAIGESVKVFENTFKEISTLQQRLESVFEDIGGKLGKYYEIKEVMSEEDNIEESERQEKYQKLFKAMLDKFGVDSPADLDDEKKKEFFNLIDKKHKGVNESTVNESYVVIDPRGNARPVGSKIQGDKYVKNKKGYYVILAKHQLKARRAIEKAGGNSTSRKIQDLMFDLRYEGKRPDKFKKLVNEAFEGLSNVISAPGIGLNLKTEAAPKMKSSKETKQIGDIMKMVSNAKKGGGSGRYGKEFEAAKKKALKAIKDMLTYSKIGV